MNLFKFNELEASFRALGLDKWADVVESQVEDVIENSPNGNLTNWAESATALPKGAARANDLSAARVVIGAEEEISEVDQAALLKNLRLLHPWRKGPFSIFGQPLDPEWRSDLKWSRLESEIADLKGRVILDVGCGNGYYSLRMVGAGAEAVVAIDPSQLFLCQFQGIAQMMSEPPPVHFLPVGLEQIPTNLRAFDTVFSMGILYHRRSPMDHLIELRDALKSGGELVLETIVIEGGLGRVLVPNGRYAKMRNVWFLPSATELVHWLERCRFKDVRIVDVSPTTPNEQRATQWMTYESLSDFLDPNDPSRTVEGHPAPIRAVIVATAP
jgi:tRNA (mo5U34)-methyltransferase